MNNVHVFVFECACAHTYARTHTHTYTYMYYVTQSEFDKKNKVCEIRCHIGVPEN